MLLWKQRSLLLTLTERDLVARYRGSLLGMGWSLLNPLLMLAIYLFMFGIVFAPRHGGAPADLADFSLKLFAGLLIHGLFAECLSRAPSLIVSQPSYVKKIVFPLEILPLVAVGAASVAYWIGMAILLFFCVVFGKSLGAGLWLLPLTWLPLLLLCCGTTWLLAALAVFLRDIGQLTGFLASVLMFLSPIFYTTDSVPKLFRPLLQWNPLTIPIETTRALIFSGTSPDWLAFGLHGVLSLAWAGFGLWFFQKVRKGFADVL